MEALRLQECLRDPMIRGQDQRATDDSHIAQHWQSGERSGHD